MVIEEIVVDGQGAEAIRPADRHAALAEAFQQRDAALAMSALAEAGGENDCGLDAICKPFLQHRACWMRAPP